MTPEQISAVVPHTQVAYPGTPMPLDLDFRGILIATSARQQLSTPGLRSAMDSGRGRLIVVGSLWMTAADRQRMARHGCSHPLGSVILTMTIPKRNRSWSCGLNLGDARDGSEMGPLLAGPESSDPEASTQFEGRYFSTNLCDLADLPEAPYTLAVHAIAGPWTSDVMMIEVAP